MRVCSRKNFKRKVLGIEAGCTGRKGENDYRKGLFPVRP